MATANGVAALAGLGDAVSGGDRMVAFRSPASLLALSVSVREARRTQPIVWRPRAARALGWEPIKLSREQCQRLLGCLRRGDLLLTSLATELKSFLAVSSPKIAVT